MSWLVNEQSDYAEILKNFDSQIHETGILQIPGAHDAMAGLIAKKSGFNVLYLSGAAYTASRGLPDLSLINSTELADRAKDIIRATDLPLIVDIDTGFGEALNVTRTIKEMEEAKVACVQIEDQRLPKKCGHLDNKQIVSTEEMVHRISAIKKTSPNMRIIARTDARAVEGIDEALKRIQKYIEAGADIIFPEALESLEEFKHVAGEIDKPVLANMTEFGKTPITSVEAFEAAGVSMVIYPVSTLRVAAKAYERLFDSLKNEGSQKSELENMQTRKELYEVLGYDEYEDLDKSIFKSF